MQTEDGNHSDVENTTILITEVNKSKRLIKEMMETKNPVYLNFKLDIEKLGNI